MSCRQLTVRGIVLDPRQQEPISGLRVELWASKGARRASALLGATATLEGGVFRILHADRAESAGHTGYHLVLREADGREVKNVEGPTSWRRSSPPAQIVLFAEVEGGWERTCAGTPTLRRSYSPLPWSAAR